MLRCIGGEKENMEGGCCLSLLVEVRNGYFVTLMSRLSWLARCTLEARVHIDSSFLPHSDVSTAYTTTDHNHHNYSLNNPQIAHHHPKQAHPPNNVPRHRPPQLDLPSQMAHNHLPLRHRHGL
jgi:hypothetical protein